MLRFHTAPLLSLTGLPPGDRHMNLMNSLVQAKVPCFCKQVINATQSATINRMHPLLTAQTDLMGQHCCSLSYCLTTAEIKYTDEHLVTVWIERPKSELLLRGKSLLINSWHAKKVCKQFCSILSCQAANVHTVSAHDHRVCCYDFNCCHKHRLLA